MCWHTVTYGRVSEWETGELSGYPVLFTLPRNTVYIALIPLMRTPRLPVVDWTDAHRRFKWTRPFRRKTKYGFCSCAITFQLASITPLNLSCGNISSSMFGMPPIWTHKRGLSKPYLFSTRSDMNRQWCCHLDHRTISYLAQLGVLLRGTQESNQLH